MARCIVGIQTSKGDLRARHFVPRQEISDTFPVEISEIMAVCGNFMVGRRFSITEYVKRYILLQMKRAATERHVRTEPHFRV